MGHEADWSELRRLFDAVVEFPPQEWSERLQTLTADPALRRETLALLASAAGGLTRAWGAVETVLGHALVAELKPGDALGPWRVERRIGSGGMGAVFLVERADGLYAQRAAVKLLHGLPDPAATARLEDERRILAGLQHPNIAHLYDGGTTPQGHPYLVMEYVDGRPVDVYCREAGLGLRARLDLFVRICGAVQAAHARLVVHCDLKPANVLVRADGTPVLLDFGISRLLGGAQTASGYGTPGYAAPEVLAGARPAIAGDIYGLGGLLLTLVSTRGPGQSPGQGAAALPAPSAWAPAGLSWRRRLRGDLDAIVARACAVDPQARYASVDALAADIGRHLALQPIQARAHERFHTATRLLRRRWREAGVAAAVLALSAGFVWHLDQARAQAEQEADIAREVSGFLVSMFEAADPRQRGARAGEDISVREVLEVAAAQVDDGLDASPMVRARLQGVIGMAYRNMGDVPRALPLLQASAEGLLASGPEHLDEAAGILNMIASTHANNRDGAAGERMARHVLALLGPDYPDSFRVAQSYNALGLSLVALQRYEEAETAFVQALIRHEEAGRERFIAVTLDNLGLMYRRWGRLDAAERAFARSTPIFHRQLGELSFDYWASHSERALVVADAGRLDEARAMFEANLARAPRIFGEHSVYVASEHIRLASVLLRQGDYRAAEPLVAAALQLSARVMGPESFTHSLALEMQGRLAEARGDAGRAETAYRRMLAVRQRLLGDDHPDTLDATLRLGLLLARHGRTEADGLLVRVREAWMPQVPADSVSGVRIRHGLAEWHMQAGRWDAARSLLDAAAPAASVTGPHLAARQHVLAARWQQGGGAPDRAVRAWREAVRQAVALHGPDSVVTATARVGLAEALLAAGQPDAASAQVALARPPVAAQLLPGAPLMARLAQLTR